MEKGKLIPILRILSTHGIKGEVKALPLTNNLELIFQSKKLYSLNNPLEVLEIEALRPGPGGKVYLIKFKDVGFERAQLLVNNTLYLTFQELKPSEAEDEVYVFELEGLKVEDTEGKVWGVISEVMPLGEYHLLRVVSTEFDFYLPLVADYVEEIRIAERRLIVKNISGLAELGQR